MKVGGRNRKNGGKPGYVRCLSCNLDSLVDRFFFVGGIGLFVVGWTSHTLKSMENSAGRGD